jgi:hypothetical protein
MTDHNGPEERNQQDQPHDEREIKQTRPSHMNQGNETFLPDQQKHQNPGGTPQKPENSQPGKA